MLDFGNYTLKGRDISKFDFGHQTANFCGIDAVLLRNGIKFTKMELKVFMGHGTADWRTMVTFKAYAPGLIWHKYESGAAGAGQNHVIIHGRKLKVSEFLKMSPEMQDKLISDTGGFKKEQADLKALNKEMLKDFTEIAAKQGWTFEASNARSGRLPLIVRVMTTPEMDFREEYEFAANWREEFIKRQGYENWFHAPEDVRDRSSAMFTVMLDKKEQVVERVREALPTGWKIVNHSNNNIDIRPVFE